MSTSATSPIEPPADPQSDGSSVNTTSLPKFSTPDVAEAPVVNTFDYRPVPAFAPASVICGLLGLSTFVVLGGILFGLIGFVLSCVCLWQIHQSEGEFGGRRLAQFGLLLSILAPGSGAAFQYHEYKQELPEGYQRVSFFNDVAAKKFIVQNGRRKLHPDVEPLVGEKIFIKGFMYQSKDMSGLKSFILLKDNGECCFGGDPKPFDMMRVVLADENATVDSIEGMIAVAGKLYADPDVPDGAAVYLLEADIVNKARTAY